MHHLGTLILGRPLRGRHNRKCFLQGFTAEIYTHADHKKGTFLERLSRNFKVHKDATSANPADFWLIEKGCLNGHSLTDLPYVHLDVNISMCAHKVCNTLETCCCGFLHFFLSVHPWPECLAGLEPPPLPRTKNNNTLFASRIAYKLNSSLSRLPCCWTQTPSVSQVASAPAEVCLSILTQTAF